jgi:hypothetical protein
MRLEKPPQVRQLLLHFTHYHREIKTHFSKVYMNVCYIYYWLVDKLTYIIHCKQNVTAIWTHCVLDPTYYNTKP